MLWLGKTAHMPDSTFQKVYFKYPLWQQNLGIDDFLFTCIVVPTPQHGNEIPTYCVGISFPRHSVGMIFPHNGVGIKFPQTVRRNCILFIILRTGLLARASTSNEIFQTKILA